MMNADNVQNDRRAILPKESKPGRLIIVSNRLPVVLEDNNFKLADGGLITAMSPVLRKKGGVWIGWTGDIEEERENGEKTKKLLYRASKSLGFRLEPVSLGRSDFDLYYKGFSNEVIWPLFHNFSLYCLFLPEYYSSYKEVNRKFSSVISKNIRQDDFIWIHDYHLIKAGYELRRRGINNKLAFFLHIPFPPSQSLIRLPWNREIIRALLEYDLIGFQTQKDKENFLVTVSTLFPDIKIKQQKSSSLLNDDNIYKFNKLSVLKVSGREVKAGVFPISIDFEEFNSLSKNVAAVRQAKELKDHFKDQTLLLAVDRLDYTKGIPHRLRAYKKLLDDYPQLHGKVMLIQIMVPSRAGISQYSKLKNEIDRLIGSINGKFSVPGWVPIQYRYRSLQRLELLAYYLACDIAWVTPLQDGMNLVAKEYCAVRCDNPGVLILSEFAGAKDQLKDGALLVNPYHIDLMTATLKKALEATQDEKEEWMHKLCQNIKEFDIYWWMDSFLESCDSKGTSGLNALLKNFFSRKRI